MTPARRASAAKPSPCGRRAQGRDARGGYGGEVRDGLNEELVVAAEQRAQQQGQGQRSALAQRPHERRPLGWRARARDRTERGVALIARDPFGALARKPARRGDAEILRGGDRDARLEARRQRRAREQGVAHARVAGEAEKEAGQCFRRKRRVAVVDECEQRLAVAALDERRDEVRRQVRPARQRRLRDGAGDRGAVDEVGACQQGRALQDRRRDVGLIERERQHDVARRVGRSAQRFRQRPAHERRGIVEHGGDGDRGLGAQGRRQAGMEIGPRKRARGFGAPLDAGPLRPGEDLAHNVWPDECGGVGSVGVQVVLLGPSQAWTLNVRIAR